MWAACSHALSQSVIAHTHSLSHSILPSTTLNIFLLLFPRPLSAVYLPLGRLHFLYLGIVFMESTVPLFVLFSLSFPPLQQNPTLSPPMTSPTSPTSSSGKTRWSTTAAVRCFPAPAGSVRMTSAAASSWRTHGRPS